MKIAFSPVFLLITILFLALVVRLAWLSSVPKGLAFDEAAYAYNAYSLFLTGKDEFGLRYPLFLESFGEFKPALLSYILIPFFAIFDPSTQLLRAVMVIIGIIGIAASYVFFRKLSNTSVALWIALMIAISPWHIHFSRALLDPILGFTLMMIGWAFLVQKTKPGYALGTLFLILSMYAYNAQRLLVPIQVISYFLIELLHHKNRIVKEWRWGAGITAIIFTISFFLMTGVGGTRALSTSYFQYDELTNKVEETWFRAEITNIINNRIVTNKGWIILADSIKRSLLHLQTDFLFFGVNLSPRHGFSRYGNLLMVALPFIIWGFSQSISKLRKPPNIFMLIWLLAATLPGGLSSDIPHSGRTLSLIIPLTFYFANGVTSLRSLIGNRLYIVVAGLIILLLGGNLTFYMRDLYLYYPEESHVAWQGQYEEVMNYIATHSNDYNHVYLYKDGYSPAEILLFWYARIEPAQVWAYHQQDNNSVNNIYINILGSENMPFECHLLQPNTLVVVMTGKLPSELNIQVTEQFFTYDRFHRPKETYTVLDSNVQSEKWKDQLKNSCLPKV
jgi:hypothetical protein